MSGRPKRAKIYTMPTGLKRFQKAESLHFITFSCFHRLPLLEATGAREKFEAVLEQTRARHSARVYAYVLMPEHVHLLVNEPPQILLAQLLPIFWCLYQAAHYRVAMDIANNFRRGTVEIESQWTAHRRGNQLPKGVRVEQGSRPLIAKNAMNGAQRSSL